MHRMSKELQEKVKALRVQLYQELFEEQPGIKRFLAVRRVLLWLLRILYFTNFICTVIVMAQMNDFSELGVEIIRLFIGLFIIWGAGRAILGVIILWLSFVVNLMSVAGNIDLLGQISSYPSVVIIMYFVQILFPIILLPTAIYLSLSSSRRYLDEAMGVENACNIFIMSQIPELNNSNLHSVKESAEDIRKKAMYDNSIDEEAED